MKFEDLRFRFWAENDIQARVEINGYDISIVRNALSYGGKKGLYEIGVYKDDKMCDPLEWGDTVKGWLTPELVEQELDKIKKLSWLSPKRGSRFRAECQEVIHKKS